MSNKIIRSICYFTKNPNNELAEKLSEISDLLADKDYEIQTKRICASGVSVKELGERISDKDILLNVGTLDLSMANNQLDDFFGESNTSFNIELSKAEITKEYVKILFKIIKGNPQKTFNFSYVFNNASSSPFFPSGNYEKEGYSIGLQLTDLSENRNTIKEWLDETKKVFDEINLLFKDDRNFLGIDSSIAPLFSGKSSLIDFIKKIGYDFSYSALTDNYLKITEFIKKENSRSVGLCGLMFPCLEDFSLAEEYEKGNFSVERNIFLSLHSGLGIDTYPIGINENQERIMNILKTIQGLSNKYKKPLSCRFVSDGKAKIGEKTDFQNQYLKDVVMREL